MKTGCSALGQIPAEKPKTSPTRPDSFTTKASTSSSVVWVGAWSQAPGTPGSSLCCPQVSAAATEARSVPQSRSSAEFVEPFYLISGPALCLSGLVAFAVVSLL